MSTGERRTPEAFSHFSLEISGGQEIVVDIQGVVVPDDNSAHEEVYKFTDPQIHSVKEGQYGIGNCGADGIEVWKAHHRCNHLCRELRDQFMAEGRSWTVYNPDDDFYDCDLTCNHQPGALRPRRASRSIHQQQQPQPLPVRY